MSESAENQEVPDVHLRALPIVAEGAVSRAEVTVVPADGIEVEDADTLKYLRLRVGDYQVPKSVFLIVDGERYEITQDALPDEGAIGRSSR